MYVITSTGEMTFGNKISSYERDQDLLLCMFSKLIPNVLKKLLKIKEGGREVYLNQEEGD